MLKLAPFKFFAYLVAIIAVPAILTTAEESVPQLSDWRQKLESLREVKSTARDFTEVLNWAAAQKATGFQEEAAMTLLQIMSEKIALGTFQKDSADARSYERYRDLYTAFINFPGLAKAHQRLAAQPSGTQAVRVPSLDGTKYIPQNTSAQVIGTLYGEAARRVKLTSEYNEDLIAGKVPEDLRGFRNELAVIDFPQAVAALHSTSWRFVEAIKLLNLSNAAAANLITRTVEKMRGPARARHLEPGSQFRQIFDKLIYERLQKPNLLRPQFNDRPFNDDSLTPIPVSVLFEFASYGDHESSPGVIPQNLLGRYLEFFEKNRSTRPDSLFALLLKARLEFVTPNPDLLFGLTTAGQNAEAYSAGLLDDPRNERFSSAAIRQIQKLSDDMRAADLNLNRNKGNTLQSLISSLEDPSNWFQNRDERIQALRPELRRIIAKRLKETWAFGLKELEPMPEILKAPKLAQDVVHDALIGSGHPAQQSAAIRLFFDDYGIPRANVSPNISENLPKIFVLARAFAEADTTAKKLEFLERLARNTQGGATAPEEIERLRHLLRKAITGIIPELPLSELSISNLSKLNSIMEESHFHTLPDAERAEWIKLRKQISELGLKRAVGVNQWMQFAFSIIPFDASKSELQEIAASNNSPEASKRLAALNPTPTQMNFIISIQAALYNGEIKLDAGSDLPGIFDVHQLLSAIQEQINLIREYETKNYSSLTMKAWNTLSRNGQTPLTPKLQASLDELKKQFHASERNAEFVNRLNRLYRTVSLAWAATYNYETEFGVEARHLNERSIWDRLLRPMIDGADRLLHSDSNWVDKLLKEFVSTVQTQELSTENLFSLLRIYSGWMKAKHSGIASQVSFEIENILNHAEKQNLDPLAVTQQILPFLDRASGYVDRNKFYDNYSEVDGPVPRNLMDRLWMAHYKVFGRFQHTDALNKRLKGMDVGHRLNLIAGKLVSTEEAYAEIAHTLEFAQKVLDVREMRQVMDVYRPSKSLEKEILNRLLRQKREFMLNNISSFLYLERYHAIRPVAAGESLRRLLDEHMVFSLSELTRDVPELQDLTSNGEPSTNGKAAVVLHTKESHLMSFMGLLNRLSTNGFSDLAQKTAIAYLGAFPKTQRFSHAELKTFQQALGDQAERLSVKYDSKQPEGQELSLNYRGGCLDFLRNL